MWGMFQLFSTVCFPPPNPFASFQADDSRISAEDFPRNYLFGRLQDTAATTGVWPDAAFGPCVRHEDGVSMGLPLRWVPLVR